jgi:hypothetical protein
MIGAVWVVNNYVYSLAAFYVFMYMWTAKLLIYMQRYTVDLTIENKSKLKGFMM